MTSGAALLGAAQIRELAATLGLRPTKAWGQNFVVDANTVRRIVRLAEVGPDDSVVEVGPGLGSLTLALLDSGARVSAVEVDPVLAAALPDTVARHAPERAAYRPAVTADALQVHSLPEPQPTAPSREASSGRCPTSTPGSLSCAAGRSQRQPRPVTRSSPSSTPPSPNVARPSVPRCPGGPVAPPPPKPCCEPPVSTPVPAARPCP